MVYSFFMLITFGVKSIFVTGFVIPGVEALVLCSYDKFFSFSFQINTTKPLIGDCLINISLLISLWVLTMQRFISPVFFICLSSSLFAFLLISFTCSVQVAASFVWSCRLNSCLNLLLYFEIECAFFPSSSHWLLTKMYKSYCSSLKNHFQLHQLCTSFMSWNIQSF